MVLEEEGLNVSENRRASLWAVNTSENKPLEGRRIPIGLACSTKQLDAIKRGPTPSMVLCERCNRFDGVNIRVNVESGRISFDAGGGLPQACCVLSATNQPDVVDETAGEDV